METRQRKLVAMRQDVADGSRSSLFLFMVRHHDDIVGQGQGGRMPWIKLCKRFAEDGLVDGHGQPPTPKRAGKTWREACEEVRRQASSQPVTPTPRRSRAEGHWNPPVARKAEPARRAASAPLTSPGANDRRPALTGATTASLSSPARDPTTEEQLAEVRRQFAANDRKRFGSM